MPQPTDFTSGRAFGAQQRTLGSHPRDYEDGADLAEPEDTHGRSYDEAPDWAKVGSFGAGLAIGILFGAGVALLLAPQSGEDTRELLGRRARRMSHRAADRWDDLRDELRLAARRRGRRVRRRLVD